MDYKNPRIDSQNNEIFHRKDIPDLESWYKSFCFKVSEIATYDYLLHHKVISNSFLKRECKKVCKNLEKMEKEIPIFNSVVFEQLDFLKDEINRFIQYLSHGIPSSGRKRTNAIVARFILTGFHISDQETGTYELFRKSYRKAIDNNFCYNIHAPSLFDEIPNSDNKTIESYLKNPLPIVPPTIDGGNPDDPTAWVRERKKSARAILNRYEKMKINKEQDYASGHDLIKYFQNSKIIKQPVTLEDVLKHLLKAFDASNCYQINKD